MLITIGKEGISQGIKIIGSHIDDTRMDLKPLPIFEDTELGFLKTHYYGGVRKYQWVTIPLALHGIIYKSDGTEIEVTIGENDTDPVFVIPDLLPHLAAEQNKLPLKEAIPGESLNLLMGSVPNVDTEVSDKVKATILQLLNNKYGITEKDFINAELEVVPAIKARDVGIDKSFVGAYGHDDRVCAYTSLMAFFEASNSINDKTCYCYFSDKEEIGSNGNTGAQCDTITYVTELISELLDVTETKEKQYHNIKNILRESECFLQM
jgi:aspartyl aminopeptidase